MSDLIDRTARQVRGLTRGWRGVHRLIASVPGPDGRAYRTACHRHLPTDKATLTTTPADCAECEAAT